MFPFRSALPVGMILLAFSLSAQQEEPKAMDPHLHPKFEVSTIKASDPNDGSQGVHTNGTRLFFENLTMNDFLTMAYGINRKQIVGAPEWFSSQHFDIRGTANEPGVPNLSQQEEMLRDLLQDRFHLKLHHDQREMTRILITVAGNVPKNMVETKSTEFLPDQTCNGGGGGQMNCRFTRSSMEDFCILLRYFLDRPIMDQTHLTGHYDFELKWAREDAPAGADNGSLPGLFTAMQEQIGLKAETSKGPTDVLMIDHVEKPDAD